MRVETADVVVIGSGAGGALIAREAARRGLKTLVLERGPWVEPNAMSHAELDMIPRLYKDGGMTMNTSMDMFILQGSCVGGSTVLANMVMIRAEDEVFRAWQGLGADVDPRAMHTAYDEVEAELGTEPSPPSNVSRSTHRFYEGATALGYEPSWMNKALGDCRGCGNCNVGCTFGTKRDALATHLSWAIADGARVLPETEVERVHHRRGKVEWVEARTGPRRELLRVVASQVIVAAGAIGSSAILLKSGVRKNVGTRLSFNAGSMVLAEFDEPLDGFDADQMTAYLKHDDYIIEATHNPLMSAALTTPGWLLDHGRLMERSPYLAYAGALVGTEPNGRVVHSPWFGHEEVRFRLRPGDLRKLKAGVRTIAECFFAAGAERVLLPTHRYRSLESIDEIDEIDLSIRPTSEISFGSAHPQGGNPMSDDPELGVVDGDLAVHGFENLFVCDASVFPSCIGVNPIDTILALATVSAPRIFARA